MQSESYKSKLTNRNIPEDATMGVLLGIVLIMLQNALNVERLDFTAMIGGLYLAYILENTYGRVRRPNLVYRISIGYAILSAFNISMWCIN